jgi:hypothetical protein
MATFRLPGMKSLAYSTLLACALPLVGCATLTEEQCRHFDWRKDGYNTGFWDHGYDQTVSDLSDLRRTCSEKYGIAPDLKKFETGYKQGKADLCTKDGGFKFGRGGGIYNSNCSKEKEDEFFVGYQRGQMVYTSAKIQNLEESVKKLSAEIDEKNSKIRSLESDVSDLESKLRSAQSN